MKLSLVQRVGLGFGLLILLVFVIAGASIQGQTSVGRQMAQVGGYYGQLLALSGQSMNGIQNINRFTGEFINTRDPDRLAVLGDAIASEIQEFRRFLAKLIDLKRDDAASLEQLQAGQTAAEASIDASEAIRDLHLQWLATQQVENRLFEQWQPRFEGVREAVFEVKRKLGFSQKDVKFNEALNLVLEQAEEADLTLKQVPGTNDIESQLVPMKAALEANLAAIHQVLEEYAEDRAKAVSGLREVVAPYERAIQADDGLLNTHISLLRLGEARSQALSKLTEGVDRAVQRLAALNDDVVAASSTAVAQSSREIERNRTIIVVLAAVAVLLAVLLGWRTFNSIKGSMRPVLTGLKRVSDGDLTISHLSEDRTELGRIGQGINRLITEMRSILNSIQLNADELKALSHESDQAGVRMRDFAERQSQRVSEMASAMREFQQAVGSVANSAEEARTQVDELNEVSRDSAESVKSSNQMIGKLNQELDEATRSIHQLAEASNNIGTIVGTIQDIAEQTNLLALNAAIEAARAGEQGRGFAVVADEVRSLANRTQQSTDEIYRMIDAVQKGAESVKSLVERNQKNAVECVDRTNQAVAAIDSFSDKLYRVTKMAETIASAATEQAQSTESVMTDIQGLQEDSDLLLEQSKGLQKQTHSLNDISTRQHQQLSRFRT